MTRNEALATRLKEVLLNGKWIANTNYKEQLAGVGWQQACQRVGELNSIAMLTYHVNYYLGGLITVFDGGELTIRDRYSFDMPEIKSDADWNALVDMFLNNAERITEQIRQMPDALLDQPFVDEKYGSHERNIAAIIEHCYYHLGQITLIRKLTANHLMQ